MNWSLCIIEGLKCWEIWSMWKELNKWHWIKRWGNDAGTRKKGHSLRKAVSSIIRKSFLSLGTHRTEEIEDGLKYLEKKIRDSWIIWEHMEEDAGDGKGKDGLVCWLGVGRSNGEDQVWFFLPYLLSANNIYFSYNVDCQMMVNFKKN